LNSIAKALGIPSACLTMLGMSRIRGLGDSARLVKSFQKLIVASLAAESQIEARHADKKRARMRSSQRKRKPGSQTKNLAKGKT
jgi:hypothetical protein